MELAILILLDRHETVAFDQIVVKVGAPPSEVRSALTDLREAGFVDLLALGDVQTHSTPMASYWRLTDSGRRKLARLRGE